MRILMLAPPGVGKRTLGAVIAAHFNVPHIAMGELLRAHVARHTDLGRAAQAHLDRGESVPDEVVLDVARRELTAARAGGEYLLEGMPRTLPQAQQGYRIALHLGMTANVALYLRVDDDELVRRLLARAALERRQDTEDLIRDWLGLYHQATEPLVSWYFQRGILVIADAMRPTIQVGREIVAALEAMRPLLDHVPEQLRQSVDLTGLEAGSGPSADSGLSGIPSLSSLKERLRLGADERR
ncbi:nucleoside monophosphate kinase [Dactylosporangium sp. NPDC049140]|uniref:adenylate kinase family protein n=1 Tax=Dactylosporangium sp. NPDC049140 TaxID=3155647 RepID=UPI0033E11451